MNCPYCNAGVHAMAKYCPKCGLPLKDDQTVMGGGAYVTDDSGGPGLWVVLGGAGVCLVIAILIGVFGNRKSEAPQQTQRPPMNPAFNPASNFGMRPTNPAFSNPAFSGTPSASRSADYNPNVRWAYKPPAQAPVTQTPVEAPEGVEAPPVNLVEETARQKVASRPTVTMARASVPDLPPIQPAPGYATLGPGEVWQPENTAAVTPAPEPLTPAQAEIRRLEQEGVITYDPVQERYVIIPGRRPRRPQGPAGAAPPPNAQPADVGSQLQPVAGPGR